MSVLQSKLHGGKERDNRPPPPPHTHTHTHTFTMKCNALHTCHLFIFYAMLNKFTQQSRDADFFKTRTSSSSSSTFPPRSYSAKSRSTHASLSLFQHNFFLPISTLPRFVPSTSFLWFLKEIHFLLQPL